MIPSTIYLTVYFFSFRFANLEILSRRACHIPERGHSFMTSYDKMMRLSVLACAVLLLFGPKVSVQCIYITIIKEHLQS